MPCLKYFIEVNKIDNEEYQIKDDEVRCHIDELIEISKNKCFYFNSSSDHFGKCILS